MGTAREGGRNGPGRAAWQAKRATPGRRRSDLPGRASRRLDARQAGERHGELALVIVEVFQLAGVVVDVGQHIEMAVAAEVEEDRLALAGVAAPDWLVHGCLDGVVRFRSRQNALGAGEADAGL